MKALTLHAPWAWGVCYLGKPVENRTWPPPEKLIGQDIAIHAGAASHWTIAEMNVVTDTMSQAAPYLDTSLERLEKILSLAYEQGFTAEGARFCSAIVAVATLESYDPPKDGEMDGWRVCSQYGWRLGNIRVIEPVRCKGAQGLWTVPADIEAIVQERILAAEVVP